MKIRISLLIIFLFISASILPAQELRVGVVEFEEKNDIGLESAGTIIAEWVVTEIAAIGKFEVEERLMLNKVLEEQKLILSGIIDESQAAEIGQLYGVDAIITGSCMKVGDSISVTGRIIDVGSGKVKKTAKTEVGSLNDLEDEVQILANNLCDISRDEFDVQQAIAEKEVFRADIGLGPGAAFLEYIDWGMGLSLFASINQKYFQVWVEGVPVGWVQALQAGAVFNLFHFLGLGATIGQTYDNLMEFVKATNLMFGFVLRPRKNIEFGLMTGGILNMTLDWGQTTGDDPLDVDQGYWEFMGNFETWLSFRITDDITILGKFKHVTAEYDLNGTTATIKDFYYSVYGVDIYVLYSFSI